MFNKKDKDTFIAMKVYVDDIILASNSEHSILKVKKFLHKCFTIKDLGKLKYILGLKVARNKSGIHPYQSKCTIDLLVKYGFLECKPATTPVCVDQEDYIKSKPIVDITGYKQLFSKLLYLTNTRPDIYYAVHQLSQHLEHPHQTHLTTAQRVLRYVKGKPTQGIFYSNSIDLKLKGDTDSDWGNCKDSRILVPVKV